MGAGLETYSVKSRFMILFAAVGAGFATYGTAGWLMQNRIDDAWGERIDINTAFEGMQKIESAQSTVSIGVERFIQNKDPSILDEIIPVLANVDSLRAEIRHSLDAKHDFLFNGAMAEFEKVPSKFELLISQARLLGLDEKSGLKGELRSSVHWVESALKEFGNSDIAQRPTSLDALNVEMLMLRRHEKDYMLRGDDKYIGRFQKRIESFKAAVRESDLPEYAKPELIQKIGDYETAFGKWSQGMSEFHSQVQALRTKED